MMQSIKELYKIGNGPSSSHTMGPEKASRLFRESYPQATRFEVILYGSLALTGKGHLTDFIIKKTFSPLPVKVLFDRKTPCTVHPNTMDLIAYEEDHLLGNWRVYSVGGGSIKIEGKKDSEILSIYPHSNLYDIKKYCQEKQISFSDYVFEIEDSSIQSFLLEVWHVMKDAVEFGIDQTGNIPGKLQLTKKANFLYQKASQQTDAILRQNCLLSAYAYAVSETNASGGIIVTAPTCGASGVLPSVLYYCQTHLNYSESELIDALSVAALIGNLIKANASISGAECGCQAEIGTACSMAAAAYASLKKATLDQIENAAEIAMEHHLGLTCDPIYGYVQIPCIERNAVASMRAIESSNLAILLEQKGRISFDMVVETMYETGKDLSSHYRETSKGGLAKKYCRNKFYNSDMEE